MKTLHANKDYVLRDGHIDILKPEYVKYASYSSLCLVASTDKSLPVKNIDRSVFVKPVDGGQIFDNNFDCYADTWQGDGESMQAGDVVPAMTKDKFVEVMSKNANPNQFTLEEMHTAMNRAFASGALELGLTAHDIIKELRPLKLPETIQCDDNYENLNPIWK